MTSDRRRPAIGSVVLRSAAYGGETALDDPAEAFHEASKLYPAVTRRQTLGIARFESSRQLQAIARGAVRRHPQLPAFELPAPAPLPERLDSAIRDRATSRDFGGPPLTLSAFAALLDAGYGTGGGADGFRRRHVPSAGALYPLELYPVVVRVDGLEPGVYHFDPMRRTLALRSAGEFESDIGAAAAVPELLSGASTLICVTAVFWRSRFKYGLRGYRFALLEAGHVVQNILLAAAALGVPALPLGGFYDAILERLLEVDGVDESAVYAVALGGNRP